MFGKKTERYKELEKSRKWDLENLSPTDWNKKGDASSGKKKSPAWWKGEE